MTLPEPSLVDRDGAAILAECIASYEAAAGRTLLPAQAERLVIDLMVYRELLVRSAIQDAGLQNLLAYARYPMIDLLGQIVGATRIAAVPAKVSVRFALAAPAVSPQTVVAGTKYRTTDRRATFALLADAVIETGASSVDAIATCTAPGIVGNDYGAGSLERVASPPFAYTITVLEPSSGGAASEGTEALRERIPTVLDARAAAGPEAAYEAHARGAHVDVIDVVALSPSPGQVSVVVLPRAGADAGAVVDAVELAVGAYDVRPMTDTVVVEEAEAVTYYIDATIEVADGLTSEEEDAIRDAATASAQAYADARASGLGLHPYLSSIYVALSVPGVVSVPSLDTNEPFTIGRAQYASCTAITVAVA